MIARIGIYFLMLGIFFSFLFVAGIEVDVFRLHWFLLGFSLTTLGATLWWRNRETSKVKRFRWFRRNILKEDQNEGG